MIPKLTLPLLIFFALLFFSCCVLANDDIAVRNSKQLHEMLRLYSVASTEPWPFFSENSQLRLGAKNKDVMKLRECLTLLGDLSLDQEFFSQRFDKNLEDAVKSFQLRHGLSADGIIGKMTRAQLNIPPQDRIKQILINIQRWEWLSGKLKDRFIIVNIPDYNLYLFENDKEILKMKTIVGKPDWPTPELASLITLIEFNPEWNIPRKIAQEDIAPKVLYDPNYLDEMHIRVFRNDGSEINPDRIDWQRAQEEGIDYLLRQDPGPGNALGLVKFDFQNNHNVYLHDTPAKSLFESDLRCLSHGCVRLERPFDLAAYLLKDNPNWSQEKLQEILDSGHTRYVKILRPIPVFITYLTAWVDENGKINFRDDIYNLDIKAA